MIIKEQRPYTPAAALHHLQICFQSLNLHHITAPSPSQFNHPLLTGQLSRYSHTQLQSSEKETVDLRLLMYVFDIFEITYNINPCGLNKFDINGRQMEMIPPFFFLPKTSATRLTKNLSNLQEPKIQKQ